VGTVLLGWAVLGEALTPLNALGVALTIGAGAAMGLAKPAERLPAARPGG
jgi:drug/metabolite transporter (DMT)-like permease